MKIQGRGYCSLDVIISEYSFPFELFHHIFVTISLLFIFILIYCLLCSSFHIDFRLLKDINRSSGVVLIKLLSEELYLFIGI